MRDAGSGGAGGPGPSPAAPPALAVPQAQPASPAPAASRPSPAPPVLPSGRGLAETVPRVHRRQLPSPTRRQLFARARQIGGSGGRRLAPLAARQLVHVRHGRGLLPAAVAARALRRLCEDLGGTFIKFGQLVASSPGLFGDAVAEEFRACLDTGPPVAFDAVRERVEADLGMDLHEAFADFDHRPIGRASIAVVYRGHLHDGREVAVKVLRPGIDLEVAADLRLMVPLAELVAKETGEQVAGSVLQMLDGLRQQLGEELDLRNEARALAQFRALLSESGLDRIVVPEPHPAFSGQNVLTMELLHGVAIDDLAAVAARGQDPAPLVEQVVRAFFTTTVRRGAFHGDLHAGNMLLLDDGRLGIIDWGIVGRLDRDTHRFVLRLLDAVLGDQAAWPDITAHLTRVYGRAIQVGLGMSDDDLTTFLRGIVEPALTRPFGEVSLAAMLEAPLVQAAKARGARAHERPLQSVLLRLRTNRRMMRLADEAGGLMSDFTRGAFLLAKQFMYFERYGKLFLADRPILADRAFLTALVEGARS
jgi:predicted unusual protein kinase regulating ubiquinone biosynthesis (AarF/ABC1/UbiB family)